MRFFTSVVLAALATHTVADWFGNAGRIAYNKWHETELERWLSDHDVPYPTPADRKDLENLVKNNWEDYVVKPYNKWDTQQLSSYITARGHEVKKGTEKNADSLISQVQEYWYETADQADGAYNNVQEWIFDSWTESQLKAFLDYHSIPNPSPRTRDSLLHTVRSNYQAAANKAGETFHYPGDWIYSSWSDSDLKAWLDERGIPAPQPGNRDKLIASLRRNSRAASQKLDAESKHLGDQLINSWDETQLKQWLDKQGVPVPQGSKKNELAALARKHSAALTASGASAYGAATSSAGNFYAQATSDGYAIFRQYYDMALNNFGLASKEAVASLSSASSVASVEASKSSVLVSKSAVSASKQASKSGVSAASSAKSAASKAKQEL